MKKAKRIIISAVTLVVVAIASLIGILVGHQPDTQPQGTTASVTASPTAKSYTLDALPDYNGQPYVILNHNKPNFTKKDMTTESYETYGKLDRLGRCTACMACVGTDLMPTGKRESISAIKPTGWQSTHYSFVDGGSLYNRSHLIAHQLTGENANERNLITGTRTMNSVAMVEFEIKTGDYIRATENHVLYRVTPIFKGSELVARGVEMEGYSVEDNGKGICFHVYCYNNEPGVIIDYKTGKSKLESEAAPGAQSKKETYILNTNNMKFHRPDCPAVQDMKEDHKKTFTGTRDSLINSGYTPCGTCQP